VTTVAREVGGGVVGERRDLAGFGSRHGVRGVGERVGDHPPQRRLERLTLEATSRPSLACGPRLDPIGETRLVAPAGDVTQPLVAARQHARQQFLDLADVVVEVAQQALDRARPVLAGLEQGDGLARRQPVQFVRVLDDRGHGPEPGRQRQLPREQKAQGVDGLHAQALRVLLDSPTLVGVTRAHRTRQLPGLVLVRLGRRRFRVRARQRLQHAVAHLARRLVGEGDRQNFLRVIDAREQYQVAAHQQLGLAGAGRRLHDERACRVERLRARRGVFDRERLSHDSSPHPPPPDASGRGGH
jgi:hypothetical protein